MNGWRRHGRGHKIRIVATLDQREAGLLRALTEQVLAMLYERQAASPKDELAELTGIRTGPSTPPSDQVLARLLPDFHRLDPDNPSRESLDSAAAMRSRDRTELLDAKVGVRDALAATLPREGGDVRLSFEQADAWLAALNDVRLALGTALDVTEDMPDELPEDDPRAPHLGVYHWLTWVQETLIQALTG